MKYVCIQLEDHFSVYIPMRQVKIEALTGKMYVASLRHQPSPYGLTFEQHIKWF